MLVGAVGSDFDDYEAWLRRHGVEVEERDVGADLLPALRTDPPRCVLPLLHGEAGEDGALREVLELVGVPYVGAGVLGSAVSMDKEYTKKLLAAAGIPMPTWQDALRRHLAAY